MKVDLYTMCIVQQGDKVLLLNRPKSKGFPGYIGPGGKVECSESLTDAATREVFEETGLKVKNLTFKGIDEFVEIKKNYRYMVFNYIATSYEGELLKTPPEGELVWVSITEAMKLPMQPWFKRRLPKFFEEGTFEIHVNWDGDNEEVLEETVKSI